MRAYRSTLILLFFVTLSVTGCYQQRAIPSWDEQWQAIMQAAHAYDPDAIPYSIRSSPAGDNTDALLVTVRFYVAAEYLFDVQYVDSRLAQTLVIERGNTSISPDAVPELRDRANIFSAVTVGPQEAIRIAQALPAVQAFIAAYDRAPSGTSLFIDDSLSNLINELGSPAAWTLVQEQIVGGEIQSLRVWIDALTGDVICVVTDGSLSNGCLSVDV